MVWQGNSWRGLSFAAVLSGCLSYGLFFGWATFEIVPSEFQFGPFASAGSHQFFLRMAIGVAFLVLSFGMRSVHGGAFLAVSAVSALVSSVLRLASSVLGLWSLVLGEVLAGVALASFLHVWLPRYRSDFSGLFIMLLFGTSICNYVYNGVVALGTVAVNAAFLLLPVASVALYRWLPGFSDTDVPGSQESPGKDRLSFVLQTVSLLLCSFASGVVALDAHLDAGAGSQIGSVVAFVLATLLTLCGRPRGETLFALAAFGTCLCIAPMLVENGDASWLVGLRSAGFWTIMMYSFAWFTVEGGSGGDLLSPASLRGMAAIYVLSGVAEVLGTLLPSNVSGAVAIVMVGLALAIALVNATRASGRAADQAAPALGNAPGLAPAREALRSLSDRAGLTEGERRVFECLSRGYSLKQTAQQLGTTEGAAKFHRHNVYQKLGVTSREELIELVEREARGR